VDRELEAPFVLGEVLPYDLRSRLRLVGRPRLEPHSRQVEDPVYPGEAQRRRPVLPRAARGGISIQYDEVGLRAEPEVQ
jgi:hypothetical protein